MSAALPAALAAAMLLLAAGCGKGGGRHAAVYPVEGQVLWDGQPLEGAAVTFYVQGAAGTSFRAPRARTDAEGRFRLATYATADGAPEGEYAVGVVHIPMLRQGGDLVPGPNDLPAKYANPKTSGLLAQVKKEPNSLPPFGLGLAKQ
jgi:hypothetical protein